MGLPLRTVLCVHPSLRVSAVASAKARTTQIRMRNLNSVIVRVRHSCSEGENPTN